MRSNKYLMRAASLVLAVLLLSEPASAAGMVPADPTAEVAPLSGEPLKNGLLEANSNRQGDADGSKITVHCSYIFLPQEPL